MRIIKAGLIAVAVLTPGCQAEIVSGDAPPGTPDTIPLAGLQADDLLPLTDMAAFAPPEGAAEAAPFSGTIRFDEAALVFPEKTRDPYAGEDLFPAFTMDFIAHDGVLVPRNRRMIDTRPGGDSFWDVIVGAGAVWQQEEDEGWSRAGFPIHLQDRFIGAVRNCVGTFAYRADEITPVAVQCSQETADMYSEQLADMRAMVPAAYAAQTFADDADVIADWQRVVGGRIPVRPLSEIDTHGGIADFFDKSLVTRAPTSMGAVYWDGALYLNPPRTRHGLYPYPDEMRHGVYSVTKSMAGALSMFYFAERYGPEIFDERLTDYIPAFAGVPEWQGATFADALNMATGTKGGEGVDLLIIPLAMAENQHTAIENIARLGDARGKPGERWSYASTNTYVLSYALQRYVEEREGAGVKAWDLVRENVLVPIGAGDFDVVRTREEDRADSIPILAYGGHPTLDNAEKITRLIANEGEFEGRQLLNRQRIREALGRTDYRGYKTDWRNAFGRYRHSFWSRHFRAGLCPVQGSYMQGFGANHVFIMPSGAIIFRFMDEEDWAIASLVRQVERVLPSCG